jgi:hypothetical protein
MDMDKAVGRLGEAAGRLTGDESLEAEGRAVRRKGELKTYVVSPRAEGGWKVEVEGARRASSGHRPSQLLVYKKDGVEVEERRTYE